MSNIAILTQSHKAIAAKKKAKHDQIKEIIFDDEARREFLTGFHKRKLAKTEAARSRAKERAKQERLEARREQRRMLREQAIENAAQVEKAYGALVDNDDEEWTGISAKDNGRDEQYEDEEMLATVTVVEDFDPDTIIHGPSRPNHPPIDTPDKPKLSRQPQSNSGHPLPLKKKSRARKIPYETGSARKKERTKQRTRRTEKAELAGGKAARKSKSARGLRKKSSSKR